MAKNPQPPERPVLLRLIQAVAKRDNITAPQLAKRAGISYRAAYQMLHDKGVPTLLTAERALAALAPMLPALWKRHAERLEA